MKYTKAGKEIEIFYLSEKDFFSQQFKDFVNSEGFSKFLHSENDVELFEKRIRRINLYRSYLDVKVLGATVNGRFVGQSCAFRSVVVANGVRREWWWSVDTFLLQECRGLGIGKALQEKFHQDFELINQEFHQYKKKEGTFQNCEFIKMNVLHLNEYLERDSQDAILCRYLLYHLNKNDLNHFFSQVYDTLKPGGIFCLEPYGYYQYQSLLTNLGFEQPYEKPRCIFMKPEYADSFNNYFKQRIVTPKIKPN